MEEMVMPVPNFVAVAGAADFDDDADVVDVVGVGEEGVGVDEDDLSRSSFWDGKLDAVVVGAVGAEALLATIAAGGGGVAAAIKMILLCCWDLIGRGAVARNAFDDGLVATSTAATREAADRWNNMVFYFYYLLPKWYLL